MGILVVVAEPEEIKLIPLAYKGLPVLVVGVGAKAFDTLDRLKPNVSMIVNIGYCGALKLPIGTVVDDADCISVDKFAETVEELPEEFNGAKQVVDMEYKWLKSWCDKEGVALKVIKVVSDNFSYKQYKKQFKKK